MASCSLYDLCTFGLSLFLPILSGGTAGSVESWSWWRAAGWLGKVSTCQENRGNESNSSAASHVKPACDPPQGLADRKSKFLLWGYAAVRWDLLNYKGLMFVKGVQKHVCINERKSLKNSAGIYRMYLAVFAKQIDILETLVVFCF